MPWLRKLFVHQQSMRWFILVRGSCRMLLLFVAKLHARGPRCVLLMGGEPMRHSFSRGRVPLERTASCVTFRARDATSSRVLILSLVALAFARQEWVTCTTKSSCGVRSLLKVFELAGQATREHPSLTRTAVGIMVPMKCMTEFGSHWVTKWLELLHLLVVRTIF